VVIQALVQSGVQSIVFAGAGAGILSSFEKAALRSLESSIVAHGTVLVRSSRVGNGRVMGREEYDTMGMIPADTLNPQKARILLMLGLTKTTDHKEIARMFAEY
jgi:L-asparaginase